jgi:hypothetical protein
MNPTHPTALALTPEQRQTLVAAVDAIIPETDTPGARAAGVPGCIEELGSSWMNDTERQTMRDGLTELEVLAREQGARHFADLALEERQVVLGEIERAVLSHAWYEPGNIRRPFDSEAPFICQLKELTIHAFFMSRIGATQVLRHGRRGEFAGDLPLDVDASSWSAKPYM